ncbi:MAG TPA: methyltransferase domain-containing protein, partial [Burkholderiaceae bacterium]|nr:methyltransferase domain-containing protein [Burkholderiaceae bacterium]
GLAGPENEMAATRVRKVLNVGGNSKDIPIPNIYDGWQHDLLDIDPRGKPDVCCDARLLTQPPGDQYDAIYCSHNLEHYYRHDVVKVLAGFRHVLKDGGFAQIAVPDMAELMKRVVEGSLDIEDKLYDSAMGPIHVVDVIYGHSGEIESSGNEFYAHKTGFTQKSLMARLSASGFSSVISEKGDLEIFAIGFKNEPSQHASELFNLRLKADLESDSIAI